MEFEIADALKLLRARNDALAKRRNLSAAEQATQVTVAPFRESGYGRPETNGAMFSPLLTLESMGYGWKIDATGRSLRFLATNRLMAKLLARGLLRLRLV